MRFIFALILVYCSVFAGAEEDALTEREFLSRQKFVYEILHRVEEPLRFSKWIQYGEALLVEKSLYQKYDHWMDAFHEACRQGALLPQGEFFGELVLSHMKQAKGLFHFFYYAKDWETFQQNVCWARMYVNEGMFVYAFSLAAKHRSWPDYGSNFDIPAIYEIFPQHFFNSKFIQQAERFNDDTWSKWAPRENNNTQQPHEWQWWKRMDIGQRWHKTEQILDGAFGTTLKNGASWSEIMKDTKIFYMPVDYTRDIRIWNSDSKMSYFTEDVERNNRWYRFNLDFSPLLSIEDDLQERSELWVVEMQKILALYYMERLSNGLGQIEDLSRSSTVRTGYNPQLTTWNGLPFVQRSNNFDYKELSGNSKNIQHLAALRDKFVDAFKDSTANYTYITRLLHGDGSVLNDDFSNSFFLSAMMYNSQINFDEFYNVQPHMLLNFETMLRDPLTYIAFKSKFLDYYRQFQQTLAPYTRKELLVEGVKIVDAKFSDIFTTFEYTDFDVTNLLTKPMKFVHGQYQWDRLLLARQWHLTHKLFTYNITVESDRELETWVRLFVGPKYDENGKPLKLNENRLNFVELDVFLWDLKKGTNFKNYTLKAHNLQTYSYAVKYNVLLQKLAGKEVEVEETEGGPGMAQSSLPKGTADGLPLQMFFIVEDLNRDVDNLHTYPFDREIDESAFFVPNMFVRDVKVYHVENEF